MKKSWVGEVMGSAANGRKEGVLILIRKGLDIKTSSVDRDEEGWRISITIDRGRDTETKGLTIYMPPTRRVSLTFVKSPHC